MTLGTGHLHPDVRCSSNSADEAPATPDGRRPFSTSGRPMWSSTMVVGSALRERRELVELGGFEIDDDVPAERRDPLGDAHVAFVRRGVDEPRQEIEAHAAHAGGVHRAIQRRLTSCSDHGDAARLAAGACSASTIALLSVPWQLACTMTLREKPRKSRSSNSFFLRRVAGRVFALGRVREHRRRARRRGNAHRPRRRRGERRLRRIGMKAYCRSIVSIIRRACASMRFQARIDAVARFPRRSCARRRIVEPQRVDVALGVVVVVPGVADRCRAPRRPSPSRTGCSRAESP